MSEAYIWSDPRIKAALRDGRHPDDIAVLNCPKCGHLGYYNEGSHFSCRHCRRSWYCCSEDEEPPFDRPWLSLDRVRMLADTVDELENPL